MRAPRSRRLASAIVLPAALSLSACGMTSSTEVGVRTSLFGVFEKRGEAQVYEPGGVYRARLLWRPGRSHRGRRPRGVGFPGPSPARLVTRNPSSQHVPQAQGLAVSRLHDADVTSRIVMSPAPPSG